MERPDLSFRLGRGGACAALCLALWLQGASAQPYDAGTDPIQQGRDLVASGRPAEAIPLLQRAVQSSPGDPSAHYGLAEAYFRNGDLLNALSSLRAAQARSGEPAFQQNVQTKARAIEAMLAEQGIMPPPAPALASTPLAETAPIEGQPTPAPAAPGPVSEFDAAAAALQSGDLDKAHILALTGLRSEPRSARGNYLLAEVLVGKKDLEGARKAYGEALAGTNLPPDRKDEIERKLLRLEVAMEPGMGDAPAAAAPAALAQRSFRPASSVEDAPAGPEDNAYRSPVNVAATLAASGDLAGPVRELRAHLASTPSDTQARIALARYLLDSGDDVSALDELGKAITAAPHNDGARNMRISIMMGRGDFGAALADLDAIVVAGRANVTTYINRGVANQRMGEGALALQDYDQAIAMDPASTGIYVNKATVLMEKRRDQAAIDALTTAIERDGRSVNAFLYRGMAYFNLGRFAPAIDDFGKALALDPGNSQALTYREQALKAANERAKAQMPPTVP